MNKVLTIVFEATNGEDFSVLTVSENQVNGEIQVINIFFGSEAEILYNKLIGEKS